MITLRAGTMFSDKKRFQLFNETGILLSSGLDLKTALEICSEGSWNAKEKEVIHTILKEVINGRDFWEALKKSGSFNTYEYQSIKIGESTGRLTDILTDLSAFLKNRIEQRKKITSAITYPSFVIIVAVLAVVFMLHYVVPMFKGVYERFGGELPQITKIVINISENIGKLFPIFLITIISFISIHFLLRNKDEYRKIYTSFLLKIPFVGNIIRVSILSRFFLAFEILSSSKVSIITSFEILQEMFTFYPLQHSIKGMIPALLQGAPLWKAFSDNSFYDKKIISLLRVGEEVNQLDLVLKTLREQYFVETEQKVALLTSVLEPLLILFIGGMVGLILISMYLPLFQLSTSFNI